MVDKNYVFKQIEATERALALVRADAENIFNAAGGIDPKKDNVVKLLRFQGHVRLVRAPFGEMFDKIVDARVKLERETGI